MIWNTVLWFQKKNIEGEAMAEALYKDLSPLEWEKDNFTKKNLDYSTESLLLLDKYLEQIAGTDFAYRNAITLSSRIGAYAGEVIRKETSSYFNWYNFNDVFMVLVLDENENELNCFKSCYDIVNEQILLYNKKTKAISTPLYTAFQFLIKDKISYSKISEYAYETIKMYKKG